MKKLIVPILMVCFALPAFPQQIYKTVGTSYFTFEIPATWSGEISAGVDVPVGTNAIARAISCYYSFDNGDKASFETRTIVSYKGITPDVIYVDQIAETGPLTYEIANLSKDYMQIDGRPALVFSRDFKVGPQREFERERGFVIVDPALPDVVYIMSLKGSPEVVDSFSEVFDHVTATFKFIPSIALS